MNQLQGSLQLTWDTRYQISKPKLYLQANSVAQFLLQSPMLSNLLNVQISFNDFVGKVQSLAGLNKLYWLGMALNNLGRGEDDDLNFLSSILEILDMGDNKFGRFLPESVSKFSAKLRMMVI